MSTSRGKRTRTRDAAISLRMEIQRWVGPTTRPLVSSSQPGSVYVAEESDRAKRDMTSRLTYALAITGWSEEGRRLFWRTCTPAQRRLMGMPGR